MEKGSKMFVGWAAIVDGVLIALNQLLTWPGGLQYLWAVIAVILGIWVLVA